MKKRYGVPMNTYGSILPGAARLARIPSLSKIGKQRLSWVQHYRKHGNGRLTCRYYGIPSKTLYKWVKRYDQKGLLGLESLTKRPHRFRQSKIPIEHLQAIIRWRKQYPMYSKYKIAVLLRREESIIMSPSTVGRIFVRHQLFFPTSIKAKKQRFRRVVKQHLHPYHRSQKPGDLCEIDMKHVSFFGARRYFFVGIDCVSKRLAIVVGSNGTARQNSKLLTQISQFPFPAQNIRVDNGSENLKEFIDEAKKLHINQYFVRYRRPKDKPFVERVIGTIEREFIQQGKLANDLEEQKRLVDQWVSEYNNFRPHQSLNYLTPAEFERMFAQTS